MSFYNNLGVRWGRIKQCKLWTNYYATIVLIFVILNSKADKDPFGHRLKLLGVIKNTFLGDLFHAEAWKVAEFHPASTSIRHHLSNKRPGNYSKSIFSPTWRLLRMSMCAVCIREKRPTLSFVITSYEFSNSADFSRILVDSSCLLPWHKIISNQEEEGQTWKIKLAFKSCW